MTVFDAPADDLLQPCWRASIRRINAVDLHIVEAGADDAPVVILLHGFPEFWWAWRHQITPLAEAGYHVVVPDMRGYNKSDAPQDVAAYRFDTLAEDVVRLADTFGAERFHLIGHDWGAVIGWWVAAQHPTRLDRLVLMNGPHPDVRAKQAIKHPTQALRSTYVAFFQFPQLPEAALGSFNFAGLRTMIQGSAKPDTSSPACWIATLKPGHIRARLLPCSLLSGTSRAHARHRASTPRIADLDPLGRG